MVTTSELWNSSEIEVWHEGLNSYWNIASVQCNLAIEIELDELYKSRGSVLLWDADLWYEFFLDKYLPWKLSSQPTYSHFRENFVRLYDENRERLREVMDRLSRLNRRNPEECIELLIGLDYIGIPMATGLLALLFPEDFGTLDRIILRNLKSIPDISSLFGLQNIDEQFLSRKTRRAVNLASNFIHLFRRKAEELNTLFETDAWTPRKIDMALWSIRDSVKASPSKVRTTQDR